MNRRFFDDDDVDKDGLVRFQTERRDGEAGGALLQREVVLRLVVVSIVIVIAVAPPRPRPSPSRGVLLLLLLLLGIWR